MRDDLLLLFFSGFLMIIAIFFGFLSGTERTNPRDSSERLGQIFALAFGIFSIATAAWAGSLLTTG